MPGNRHTTISLLPLWHATHESVGCGEYAGDRCRYGTGGCHDVNRWQLSHDRVVTKWLAGRALAALPLWQVAQVVGATPACV